MITNAVRIIAGPTIGRTLAELGAQVIKVNPPHLRDINLLQYTLTTGTHTVALDARQPEQKAQLESLIAEADVFIDGYRPGSLERLGFGKERVMELAGSKGIIYIDENAYGMEGMLYLSWMHHAIKLKPIGYHQSQVLIVIVLVGNKLPIRLVVVLWCKAKVWVRKVLCFLHCLSRIC